MKVGGNATDGPSKVAPSLDVHQTSHASIPESGMFLRRCDGEVALVKAEFLDDLEFEGLPLRKQRKMLAKDLFQSKSAFRLSLMACFICI